jgi:ribonuclease P protein component
LSLQRSDRLRRASEIQVLFQHGNREERPSFVALWQARMEGRQVGFAVSRRVGGAVARNRTRRRIREAYRRQQEGLPKGVAVMFIGRPAALTRRFTVLLDEMRQTLESLARAAG